MKFLIIGDLHGQKPNIYYKDFDAIIAPGDFCLDKDIRKVYHITYKEFLKDPYNYRDWWEIYGKVKAKKITKKSLFYGRRILEFLNSFDVPVYLVPGNWDFAHVSHWKFLNQDFLNGFLLKDLKNLVNTDGKVKSLKNYSMIGYGKCNGPELYKYRDYKNILKKKDLERNKRNYKKLLKRQDILFKKAEKKKKPIIFLSHNVPFNTKLDKITDKKSLRYGYHYGSLVARKMIDKYRPLVCIGGHMHEHFGKDKVGKTICINAGFGSYVNTFLELKGDKIKKLEFYNRKK